MRKYLLLTALTLLSTSVMAANGIVSGSSNLVCTMKCADGTSQVAVNSTGGSFTQASCQSAANSYCQDHGGVASGYPILKSGITAAPNRISKPLGSRPRQRANSSKFSR